MRSDSGIVSCAATGVAKNAIRARRSMLRFPLHAATANSVIMPVAR